MAHTDLSSCAVRTATLSSDIDRITAIKQNLHPAEGGRGGGFILGSSRELYRRWIETAVVKVLQQEERKRRGSERHTSLVGYAICLPDAVLRQSELWQKKDRIDFNIAIDSIVHDKIAYFEQLAILPRYRYALPQLLKATLETISAQGHRHLFTTTVCKPFNNCAAHGLLKRSAARTVGYLQEHHPVHGTIVSRLHYMSRDNYQHALDIWEEKSTRMR